jgi:hypothetical protein
MNAKRQAQNDLHRSELLNREIYWQKELDLKKENWERESEIREIKIADEHASEVKRLNAVIKNSNLKNKEIRTKVYSFLH